MASSTVAMTGTSRTASSGVRPSGNGGNAGNMSVSPSTAEAVDVAHIHGVEALADAKHEHAEHDEGDQDRERDRELDHQRHALGAGCREHKTILERHEADDQRHGVAPRDHHEEAQ